VAFIGHHDSAGYWMHASGARPGSSVVAHGRRSRRTAGTIPVVGRLCAAVAVHRAADRTAIREGNAVIPPERDDACGGKVLLFGLRIHLFLLQHSQDCSPKPGGIWVSARLAANRRAGQDDPMKGNPVGPARAGPTFPPPAMHNGQSPRDRAIKGRTASTPPEYVAPRPATRAPGNPPPPARQPGGAQPRHGYKLPRARHSAAAPPAPATRQ